LPGLGEALNSQNSHARELLMARKATRRAIFREKSIVQFIEEKCCERCLPEKALVGWCSLGAHRATCVRRQN